MRRAGLVLATALAVSAAGPADARGPRMDTDEYRKSWGLEAIGARTAAAD